MNFLIPLALSFALSLTLTKVILILCIKYQILPEARTRDLHSKPLPRLGGLAIFISFLIISIIYFVFSKNNYTFSSIHIFGIDKQLLAILFAGSVVAISMSVDDLIGLKAWQKLAIQVFAVLIIIASGIGINTLANPFGPTFNLNSVYIPIIQIRGITYHFSLWSDLLTLFWVVGMMNVINFVDGVDGLAAGLSSIGTVFIFLLALELGSSQSPIGLISIILTGSILGFLVWNFPPAKIFMGDSGSMFIGFLLGVLPLLSGGKLATAFLVLGFPIVDGIFVAFFRIIRRKNPFTTPDKTHLHHRFLLAGFSPRQAVMSLYVIAAAFGWVALRSTTFYKIIASVVLVMVIFILIIILNIMTKRKTNAQNLQL